MRSLALLLPLLILCGLFVWLRQDRAETIPELDEPVRHAAFDVIWISHDWVEVVPSEAAKLRAESRRKTFGLDAAASDAECFDPNCRACLIDVVYGREF